MSGNNPELSIILPVYNVAPWLFECLDSIAAQTFTNFEAILVDDGSTDFSGLFCDSYARKDSRFRVIHQSNQGVSAARNVGIEAARAPLLAFIDPDDFISPNFFDGLITALRRENADVAVSGVYYVEEDGDEGSWKYVNKAEMCALQRYKRVFSSNYEVVDAYCKGIITCDSWGKVYKKGLWADVRFPTDISVGEDVQAVTSVLTKACCVVYSCHSVYYYRQRQSSILHTVSLSGYRQNYKATSAMVQAIKDFSPDKVKQAETLKVFYDFCCLQNYLKHCPKELKSKSILYIMCETAQETEGGIR